MIKLHPYYYRAVLLLSLFLPISAAAQVILNNPKTYICVGGGFVTVSDIIIQESISQDINSTGANEDSLILIRPSANFVFQAGPVSITDSSVGSGGAANAYCTDSTIVLKYTVSNTNAGTGKFTVSGVQVKATASDSGSVTRQGGDAAISGLTDGTVIATFVTTTTPPVVTSDPTNMSVCVGSSVRFSISASGKNLTYRWQQDTGGGFSDISDNSTYSGSSTDSLAVNPSDLSLNGAALRCIVSGTCGGDTSTSATLTVNGLPAISVQPADSTGCLNSGALFYVVSPDAGITYQWQQDAGSGFSDLGASANYTGETSDSLDLNNLSLNYNTYKYRVVLTNSNSCQTISDSATLMVNSLPSITSAPKDSLVCLGNSATFGISATGSSLQYKWQSNQGAGFSDVSNGGVFSGASTDTLNVSAPGISLDQTLFRTIVFSSCGADTSASAKLTVHSLPSITSAPKDSLVCLGNSATFGISATGSSLQYKWQSDQGAGFADVSNGGVFSGASTDTLNVSAPGVSLDQTLFRTIVFSSCGADTSASVKLTVHSLPSITSNPKDSLICPGNSATFGISATGSSLQYKWQSNQGAGFADISNGAPFSGAATNTLTVSNPAGSLDQTLFRAIAFSTCGADTSTNAKLSIAQDPVITNQPAATLNSCSGGTFDLTVTATGTGLSYQWFRNGSGLVAADSNYYSGQLTNHLHDPDVEAYQNGYTYQLKITNQCNVNTTSNITTLYVNEATIVGLSSNYCPYDPKDTIKGLPYGGSFNITDTSVLNSIGSGLYVFNPANAPKGTNINVTYTYTAAACTTTITQAVTVNTPVTVKITSPADSIPVFSSQAPKDTLIGTPLGGTFIGQGVGYSNGVYTFDPSSLQDGSYTITYTVSQSGCTYTADKVFKVSSLPSGSSVIPELKTRYCAADSMTKITWAGDNYVNGIVSYSLVKISGPGVYGSKATGFVFIPDSAANSANGGPGTKILKITYKEKWNLSALFPGLSNLTETYTISDTTVVYANPLLSFQTKNPATNTMAPLVDYYCDYSATLDLVGNYSGNSFWIVNKNNTSDTLMSESDTLSFQTIGGKDVYVIYQYTDPNSKCSSTLRDSTEIISKPPVPISTDTVKYCQGQPVQDLTAIALDSNFMIRWYNDQNVLKGSGPDFSSGINSSSVSTNYFFLSQVHKASGCESNLKKETVIINPLPTPGFTGLSNAYCVDHPVDTLIGNPMSSAGLFSGPGIQDLGNGKAVFSPANAAAVTILQTYAPDTTFGIQYFFTNPYGCTDSFSQATKINKLPNVGIAQLRSYYCQMDSVINLNGYPSGGNYKIDSNSTSPYLNLAALDTGSHRISYFYTDLGTRCSNDTMVSIRIYPLPKVDFSISGACQNDTAKLTSLSSVPAPDHIDSLTWNLGFGNISHELSPDTVYKNIGPIEVTLTARTALGCINTRTKDTIIEPYPMNNFNWESICFSDTTRFLNRSDITQGYQIVLYSWDFGDGNTLSDSVGTGTYNGTEHFYQHPGLYNVLFSVESGRGCITRRKQQVYILPKITPTATVPYSQNFENGNGGFISVADSGSVSSWSLGTPDKYGLTQAASGTHAWVTSLDSVYNPDEHSAVDFPCFVLDSLERPMISMKIVEDLQQGFDGAVLQYSNDGGISWLDCGAMNDGIHWFDNQFIISDPGNQNITQKYTGWSAIDTSYWKIARNRLDFAKNPGSMTRFRLAFASDKTNPYGSTFKGFGFDDVWIGNRKKTVLVEHFTNTSSQESVNGDDWVNSMLDKRPLDAVSVQYHTSFPGKDGFNTSNPADPSAKVLYYGVSQIPYTFVDGNYFSGNSLSFDTSMIDKEALTDPLFDITLATKRSASDMSIQVNLKSNADLPLDQYLVNAAIIERAVAANQAGNDQIAQWVLRKLLPDAGGTSLHKSWTQNESQTIQLGWNWIPYAYDTSQVGVIVFIQNNTTKEVYQTAYVPGSGWKKDTGISVPAGIVSARDAGMFEIYPNPAGGKVFVNFSNFEGSLEWVLSDSYGREIMHGTAQTGSTPMSLDIDGLASGIYIIQFDYQGRYFSGKIVKR